MDYKSTEKQIYFFNALIKVATVFGETEVGCSEVDIPAVVNYICSNDGFTFAGKMFDYSTEGDMYEYITNQILNDFPIWRFLKCSDWTKGMFEKSFTKECEYEYLQLQKEYKCYTCKYYAVINTMLGPLDRYTEYAMKFGVAGKPELPAKRCIAYEKLEV